MDTAKKRSEALQKRIERTKADAHERVVKRGVMDFPADEEMMKQILDIARDKKLPAGLMVRSWVAERLIIEMSKLSDS